jgi:biopolymer transport protein TolR
MSRNPSYFRLTNHYKPADQVMSNINVTPFIDVMLVLLVIFMVSAPLLVNGLNVNLPDNNAAPALDVQKPFIITVTKDSKIFYQKKEVELADLGVFVTDNLLSKNSRIYVRGDQELSYGMVMKVISKVNKVGYKKVSLVTDNELSK